MANYKTIRDYLVGLGFSVDQVSERKFQDALKRTRVAVEKFTKASTEGFAVVGGAFIAATAAVAGATIGLMRSTAQQDLGFQVFARRMMMGTDAAKKMKIATDALGYSLEEIIWGPPELAERYQQLIKDQTRMMELLGGDRGEKAFRNIRDIEFQFTRMGPALQYFGMRLTEDVLNKLSGSPMALKERLQGFVDWFESPSGFVRISDKISSVVAPAFLKLGAAVGSGYHWITGSTLTDTFNPANPRALDILARNVGNSPFLGDVSGAFDTLPKLKAVKPSTLGGIWDSNKSVGQNLQDLFHFGGGMDQILGDLAASGRTSGNAALMLALAEQETSSLIPKHIIHAQKLSALGKICRSNWPKGKRVDSEADQISVMNSIIFGNLKKRKGNLKNALHDYYGWGQCGAWRADVRPVLPAVHGQVPALAKRSFGARPEHVPRGELSRWRRGSDGERRARQRHARRDRAGRARCMRRARSSRHAAEVCARAGSIRLGGRVYHIVRCFRAELRHPWRPEPANLQHDLRAPGEYAG